jgi:hypothetical protein
VGRQRVALALPQAGFQYLRRLVHRNRRERPGHALQGVGQAERGVEVVARDGLGHRGRAGRVLLHEGAEKADEQIVVAVQPRERGSDVHAPERRQRRRRHGRRGGGRHPDPSGEHRLQPPGVDRLRHVIVHAGREAGDLLGSEGVARRRDDGDGPMRELPADGPGRLEAVHLGHLHVHKDRVEPIGTPSHRVHGLAPVVRHLHHHPHALEHHLRHPLVEAAVLHDKDMRRPGDFGPEGDGSRDDTAR